MVQNAAGMEIQDIIKSDADRLFIVDPECYIIFTGESTNDIQPFIRIGNWIDMPVELIPLIENIIITDSLIGNPSHEQFNIEVRSLATNRYIGSRAIVMKFLDYQKIFGLDLTNASVVDIEKDLPVLSAEKNISNKDRFIGVFYRDGNFKVLLNKNTIFDLNTISRKPITNHNFHDMLSETNNRTRRYDGSGLVIVGHNPIFYHKKYFYSYLFPVRYFREFSALCVDPGKIQALFYPSLNLINISKFFKWLNRGQKKIRIFTNNTDIALVKKIFSNCFIKNENFSSLNFRTGNGLLIKNYPETYSLKLRFDAVPPAGDSLTVAFIKGSSGIKTIIKDKPDVLAITYSVFEDINLLLKSTTVPFVIIDDGNKNIARLGGREHIILRAGMQYEFRTYSNFNDIIALPEIEDETISQARSDPDVLAGSLPSAINNGSLNFKQMKDIFNLLALVRIHLENTKNRKIASRLKNAAGALEGAVNQSDLVRDASRCAIILAVYNGSIYQVISVHDAAADRVAVPLFDEITVAEGDQVMGLSADMQEQYNRILSDRERLLKLIGIYVSSEQYSEKNMPDLKKLDAAIATRKEQYSREKLSLDHAGDHIRTAAEGDAQAPSIEIAGIAHQWASRIRSLPGIVKIGAPVLLLLIISAILLWINFRTVQGLFTAETERIVQSQEIDTRFRELGKKYNIRIKDNDIMNYANRVAVKNGYHKIAATKIKEKNPDWIYPDNIFMMLDGQRVIVSKGDTLWNLSKNKLIESSIAFEAEMRKANTADIKERAFYLKRARRHAMTREQVEQITKAAGDLPDGGSEDTKDEYR